MDRCLALHLGARDSLPSTISKAWLSSRLEYLYENCMLITQRDPHTHHAGSFLGEKLEPVPEADQWLMAPAAGRMLTLEMVCQDWPGLL